MEQRHGVSTEDLLTESLEQRPFLIITTGGQDGIPRENKSS